MCMCASLVYQTTINVPTWAGHGQLCVVLKKTLMFANADGHFTRITKSHMEKEENAHSRGRMIQKRKTKSVTSLLLAAVAVSDHLSAGRGEESNYNKLVAFIYSVCGVGQSRV